ncbi:MAG: RluA family pseudouridine synthase [Putridiphycobacter sp.]|nr:RluA family pseudouridine synthase [Putridiphycobacter sp.]
MKIISTHQIQELKDPMRLNTYCEQVIDFFESRKSVKKAIKRGEVLLNQSVKNGGTWLKTGDIIQIIDLENRGPKPYELAVPVVYEDDHIAIVNKPAGLTVSGNQYKTLYNTLAYNLTPSRLSNRLPHPLPTHRLDNQTSGLVLIAKSKSARISLGNMFTEKKIHKSYHAIAMGRLPTKEHTTGVIRADIDGKKALTKFIVLSETRSLKNNWLSLVKLSPITGRTHQIRKHLLSVGTPILGDKLYAAKTIRNKGLFLCATDLTFKHPATNEPLHISIDLPAKFKKRLEGEHKRWAQYNADSTA